MKTLRELFCLNKIDNYVSYDALWVAALAENNTKATHDINYLKNTIVKIADSYNGITGNTTLNQFGDMD
jgi:hypothetical protein